MPISACVPIRARESSPQALHKRITSWCTPTRRPAARATKLRRSRSTRRDVSAGVALVRDTRDEAPCAGVVGAPNTGYGLKCRSPAYGDFLVYPKDTKCSGTGLPSGNNFTAGCTDSADSPYAAKLGRFGAGGSTRSTCVSSPTPYTPAPMSLSTAFFVSPQPTCPSTIYGPGNEGVDMPNSQPCCSSVPRLSLSPCSR